MVQNIKKLLCKLFGHNYTIVRETSRGNFDWECGRCGYVNTIKGR